MGHKLNCAVEVMPRFLFRLVESTTLNLPWEAQIKLVSAGQVQRSGRVDTGNVLGSLFSGSHLVVMDLDHCIWIDCDER